MSLILLDSFDHYGTLKAGSKITAWDGTGAGVFPPSFINYSEGRNGSAGQRNDRSGNFFTQGVTVTGGEWIQVGMAYHTRNDSDTDVISISDAATGGIYQCVLKRLPNGSWRVRNGANDTFGTTLGTTRARLWHAGEFAYIEFRVRKHATLGEAHVYVNGKKELALTGVNTIGSGPSGAIGRVEIRADGYCDDLYICDSGGPDPELDASNDATPGDVYVEMLIAQTGNGFHTDWTPSSGVDHGAMVDDPLNPSPEPSDFRTDHPDDAATVNASMTVGHKDSYTHANISQTLNTTIFGVQYNPWLAKDDVGVRFVRSFVRIGGVDHNGAVANALGTNWIDWFEIWQRSPATSNRFTVSEVDGAEFGVEVTA